MKFLIAFVVLCAAIASTAASGGYGGGSSHGGSASIPAPPCANNYLFSCQPSMQPAPCSQPQSSSSYGSSGSYSENVPRYIAAPYNGLQYPQ